MQKQGQKQKKLIIFVGRMGSGKSSIIKTLVEDQLKVKIECKNSPLSVTQQRAVFPMSQESKSKLELNKNEQIWMMDTPGTDNPQAALIVISQIQYFVRKYKFDILAMFYVSKLGGARDFKDSFQLYKRFPIKKDKKPKLSCFIFTHLDTFFHTLKQASSTLQTWNQQFINQNLCFKQNQIQWMSKPSQNSQIYEILVQNAKNTQEIPKKKIQQTQKKYELQWKKLGQFLNNCLKHQMPFTQYCQQIDKLYSNISIQIQKFINERQQNNNQAINNNQNQLQNVSIKKTQLQYNFKVQKLKGYYNSLQTSFKVSRDQTYMFIQKALQYISCPEVAAGGLGVVGTTAVAFVKQGVTLPALLLFGFGLVYVGGVYTASSLAYLLYKNFKKPDLILVNSNPQLNYNQHCRKQLNKILQQKCRFLVLKNIQQLIYVKIGEKILQIKYSKLYQDNPVIKQNNQQKNKQDNKQRQLKQNSNQKCYQYELKQDHEYTLCFQSYICSTQMMKQLFVNQLEKIFYEK